MKSILTCFLTVLLLISTTLSFSQSLGTAPLLATSNVAEASQYGVVYELTIPANAAYSTDAAINYAINNSGLTGLNYTRVAYFMQLDTKWVWVSMNKFNTTLAELGIPAGNSSVAWKQVVTGMNVVGSANSNVTSATNINGNLEIWPQCYGTSATLAGIGGDNNTYDFNDDRVNGTGCYGSFQVHNYGASQTIFAYNNWIQNGYGDLGIGNNPGTHPDWTFERNANTYTTRKLYILVNSGVTVSAPSTNSQNLCINAAATALSVSATPASGTTISSYKWYSNTKNSNSNGTLLATNTTSATTDSYTPVTTAAGTLYYYVIVTSSNGSTAISSVSGGVTVSAASVGGSISADQTICAGTQPSSLTISGSTGSIQWQSSTNNIDFTDISGATSTVLSGATIGTLTSTKYFRAKVTSGACGVAYSSVATVLVNALPVSGTITGNATVCAGINSNTLSISGNIGNVQWQSSTNNSTFTDIAGEVGSSYVAANLLATTYYRVVVTNANCTPATSNTLTVTVNPLPTPTISASGLTTFCNGGSVTLTTNGGSAGNALTTSSGKYVEVPTNSSLNFGSSTDFTYEAWVKLNGTQSDYSGIVCKGYSGPFQQLVIVNQRIAFEINNGSSMASGQGTTNLNDGNWHHLAMVVTRSSANCKLYVDGVQEASVTSSGISGNLDNSINMLIGVERGKNIVFNGNIDEVRIWNTARTQAQLQSYKNISVDANSTNLVAYYKLDEASVIQ